MKVVLLEDVKNVGKRGEIVDVSVGYARNYLLSQKLAVVFNVKIKNEIEQSVKAAKKKTEQRKKEALLLQKKLTNIELEFQAKADPNGKMIGTISYKQITEKLAEDFQLIIDKKKFIDKQIINDFGVFYLKNNLFENNIIGIIKIKVKKI